MQLSLSYKLFRWHPLNIMHVIASWFVFTLSYVASYLCALSIVSYFLALADIKTFSCKYSQITSASDWPRLFAPYIARCFYLAINYQHNAYLENIKMSIIGRKLGKCQRI